MCRSQAKLQKLSLTYEFVNMKLKTENFTEKSRVTKIVINDTKSCSVQLESGPLKVSCHQITIGQKQSGTILTRLSDYRPMR